MKRSDLHVDFSIKLWESELGALGKVRAFADMQIWGKYSEIQC